jgi:hypothetical protein
MATSGLSLVGFMDQQEAIQHLRDFCIPVDPAEAALLAEWTAARDALGAPLANAGQPEILPIPPEHSPYILELMRIPWFADTLQHLPNTQFQLVEIEPLLAYQFHVCKERSEHHCRALPRPPTLADLMPLALPQNPPTEHFQAQLQQQSLIIKSRSLNLRMVARGIFDGDHGKKLSGMIFAPSLPAVHVVRLNGRCYLHNGFHRAVGARLAGATHIPCLFRDVADAATAGIQGGRATFSEALLNSANPPTVGHFTQGRAREVKLRSNSRVMHVSWAEYVVFDE